MQSDHMVFVGVTDPINPVIEAEQVSNLIQLAAEYVSPSVLGSTDDCEFARFADDASTSREIAFEKAGTDLSAGR
jgi:5-methyltetrahydropteroyltriglutamate--homocysteine methyltransferase